MNFQQVALAVMAFSSARGGTIVRGPHPESQQQLTVVPPFGLARIIVEQLLVSAQRGQTITMQVSVLVLPEDAP